MKTIYIVYIYTVYIYIYQYIYIYIYIYLTIVFINYTIVYRYINYSGYIQLLTYNNV